MTLPSHDRRKNDHFCSKNDNDEGHAEVSVVQNSSANIPQPASTDPVETNKGSAVSALVEKSKKAAASLFTLLHAKNCKLGVHRCSHSGCPEAKLIFLHIKTCKATDTAPCPSNHKGCNDARKLLAHYRKCREIRSRQVANNRSRSQQHVCLVCSLVARSAKGALDRTRSTSPKSRSSRHLIPSLNLSTDASLSRNYPVGQRPRSNSPFRCQQAERSKVSALSKGFPRMPPPPPRFPVSSSTSSREIVVQSTLSDALRTNETANFHVRPSNQAMLGKSLDSSASYFRQRAESFDVRSSRFVDEEQAEPMPQDHGDSESEDLQLATDGQSPPTHRRRRSASYSIPSTFKDSGRVFDPIMEEPVGEELQRILEGDS